jgi:phosphopantothenate-cysteine ligase
MVQGIANLATLDANKKRIYEAGALPMLVRCLNERQHQWDKAVFWSAGALWNLAFDEEIKVAIRNEPGALDALEEARRLGSENTKMKARGALWMIEDKKEETEHVLSEEDMAKLSGGAVDGAKAQVMLSYEWRTQQQVMLLKEELMEQGFTVWMDVDRMMGSTLEAMAAAIEQSDAIIMCVTHRYKESQACRTEAEYAYTRKKPLIPVMFEKSYKPDGWLGIIMGSKLYYNMHNSDEMRDAIPGLVSEVSAVHGERAKPAFLAGGDAAPAGASAGATAAPAAAPPPAREKVTVPQDMDTLSMWLEGRGLQRYRSAFEEQHLYGKALLKLHEEIGYGDPAEAGYHELFRDVLGITSYGHRLLLLAELEELIGPVKWRRR